MGSLRIVPILLLLASPALAQTYGIGKAPTAAELAQDITISPTGAGLPPGHGTAAEGAKLFVEKGCVACHGPAGVGGVTAAPNLIGNKGTGPDDHAWNRVNGGEAAALYRFWRRMRRSCGITSVAACLSGTRGLLRPMRSMR